MKNESSAIKLIIYILLILPFFKPDFFNYAGNNYVDDFYKYFSIIASIIIIYMYIRNFKKSKIILYIMIFFVLLLISTILNNGDTFNCIDSIIKTLSLCLLTEYGIKNEKKTFLKSFEIVLSILVYVNFISLILYKNGMYINLNGFSSNWFLGYKNSHILYIIPSVLVCYLNSFNKKISLRMILLLIISTLSILMVWSGTALIGIILIWIFILNKKIMISKIFNIKNYCLFYLIIFFGIIIFKLQNVFSFIIVGILNKDLTFTGRTMIWDKVLLSIGNKKFLGYGNKTFEYSKIVHTSHNQLLEVLYKTGIIGTILYLIIIFQSCKKLYENRKHDVAKFISLILLIYFIMMIAEYYNFMMTFFVFVIAYNVDYIIKKDK